MYCINPESDEPIFCLFDQIGIDEANPTKPFVDGNQFAKELLYMDGAGKKRIQIWINSEGGSIKDGFSIISAMLKSETKIDTLVVGIAYSMGGVIALMGRKVEAMDFSSLMYHMGYNPDGTEDKALDIINKGLITAVSVRRGKSEEEVIKILKAETYYTAQQAKNAGIIDEVINCSDSNKPRQTTDAKSKHKFGLAYVNKILTKKQTMNKSEICTLLGLDENVSDAVAMESLKKHIAKSKSKAKAKADDDDMDDDDKAKKMKALEEEMKALKAKMEDDKAQAKAEDDKAKAKAEEDKAKAEEDSAKAKAKSEIEAKATSRGLVFEEKQINNFVAMAGTTEAGLKAVIDTIEAIPVIKKAAVVKSVNKEAADSLGIALIDAGEKEERSPIGIAAGDTSKMVNSINSFNFHKDWTNRKR